MLLRICFENSNGIFPYGITWRLVLPVKSKMSFTLLKLIILALIVNFGLAFDNIDSILDKVLQDNLDTYGIQPIQHDRIKRAEKSRIVMKKQKAELPICQNMKGILGEEPIVSINSKNESPKKMGLTQNSWKSWLHCFATPFSPTKCLSKYSFIHSHSAFINTFTRTKMYLWHDMWSYF
mgnify:CR=1 FL=1